jgi:hypothetical protein
VIGAALALWAACSAAPRGGASMVQTTLQGRVMVRHPAAPGEARAIVLLVGAPVEEAPPDTIAVPLEYEGWLRLERTGSRCWFPAGQLAAVAREVEASLGVGRVLPTWVVGQGESGGSIAVLAALQAPPGLLQGVVAVGFRAGLEGGREACGVDRATWTSAPPATTPLVLVRPKAPAWAAASGLPVDDAVRLGERLGR